MHREIGEYIIRDWQMADAPSIVKYANNRKIWMHLRDAFPHPYGIQTVPFDIIGYSIPQE